jgi:hypothetical protein
MAFLNSQAIAFFRHAAELKPNWALAQYNLGVVFLKTNDRAAALAQYRMLKSMGENVGTAGSSATLAEKLYAGIYRGKLLVVVTVGVALRGHPSFPN